MPASSNFTGSELFLESVIQIAPATLLVRFSQDPLLSNPGGANDGLNPSNYSLSGVNPVIVSSSTLVSADPQAVHLNLSTILLPGEWTLTVNNIQTALGDVLTPPTSLIFTASDVNTLPPISQGATPQTAETTLRRHLNPSLIGKAWDALIAGLAAADSYLITLAKNAFDQLFIASASGKYLDRLASDDGIIRPSKIGISDDVFRDLVIKVSAEKITLQSFLQVLETYYGSDAVRATIDSTSFEPYNIQEGDDLVVELEGMQFTIVFHQNDFNQLGQAKAIEIAAVISRTLELNGNNGYAKPILDKISNLSNVRIYSGALGLRGAIRVLGGRAQDVLNFPTTVLTTQTIGTQWKIETPIPAPTPSLIANRVRYTFIGGTNPTLQLVHIGDYVNIYGSVFNIANRGHFSIVDVNTSYFEIENLAGVNQATVTQLAANDLIFYRPDKFTINSKDRFSLAAQGDPNIADVILAATTQAVSREINSGAYLHSNSAILMKDRLTAIDVTRVAGVTTVTTSINHNLSIGDTFYLSPGDPQSDKFFFDSVYTITAITANTFDYSDSIEAWPDASATLPQYIYPCYRDETGLVNIKTISNHQLVNDDAILVDNLKSDINGSPEIYSSYFVSSAVSPIPLEFYGLVTLQDGRVLMCGGLDSGGDKRVSMIYDPTSNIWSTVTQMNVGRSKHTATLLNNGRVLVTGGNEVFPKNTCEIYDVPSDTWINVPAMSQARFGHIAVLLSNGNVLVTGGGSATAEIYNPILNSWTTVAAPASDRVHGQGIKLNNNTVLVGGGWVTSSATAIADCELYNPFTDTWDTVQSLSNARHGHRFILANNLGPDGRVLAIGGTPDAAAVLDSIEIYEPMTRTWTPGASMAIGRAYFGIAILGNKKIEISGGLIGAATKTDDISLYNPITNIWENGIDTLSSVKANHEDRALINGLVLIGTDLDSNGSLGLTYLFNNRVRTYAAGGLNGTFKVLVNTPTNFIYQTDEINEFAQISPLITTFVDSDGAALNSKFYLQAATTDPRHVGPYIYDTQNAMAITGVSTTVNQLILEGQGYNLLTVIDTTNFPDNGFLVFAFGTDLQVGPVAYSSKAGSTLLVLDSSFIFPVTLPIGTNLILLKDRNLGIPAHPESSGSFYLTDSISGRIAAENTIKSIEAAGSDVEFTIDYPGTIGLGNGDINPNAQGIDKVNDAVYIWGSDQEVADARKK